MAKYVIKRDQVWAGILAHEFTILKSSTDPDITKKYGNYAFVTYNHQDKRAMLFNIEDGLAKDLIYTTSRNYPSVNNPNKKEVGHYFYVEEYVNLSKFLKQLNFSESLTQRDLDAIYHKLITNKYWLSLWLKSYKLQLVLAKSKITIPDIQLNTLMEINQIHNGLPNAHEDGYEKIKRRSKIKNGK